MSEETSAPKVCTETAERMSPAITNTQKVRTKTGIQETGQRPCKFDFLFNKYILSGSMKERDVYKKAGHQVTDPTNEQAQPQNLKLSIRHVTPIFGTDFDVIVEVRV